MRAFAFWRCSGRAIVKKAVGQFLTYLDSAADRRLAQLVTSQFSHKQFDPEVRVPYRWFVVGERCF